MGAPLSSATTWGCQSPRQTHDTMTERDSLNARRCVCVERDMPKRRLKRSYLRRTLLGKKCAFLQCSAGRWPKPCQSDNHLPAQRDDSFCSQIARGGALFSWAGLNCDWEKKEKKKKFDLNGKFVKEWKYCQFSFLFVRPLKPHKWGSQV